LSEGERTPFSTERRPLKGNCKKILEKRCPWKLRRREKKDRSPWKKNKTQVPTGGKKRAKTDDNRTSFSEKYISRKEKKTLMLARKKGIRFFFLGRNQYISHTEKGKSLKGYIRIKEGGKEPHVGGVFS